jgi:hypothetical protein
MDDKTFERFIVKFINNVQKDKRFNGVCSDEIRETLYLLKDSSESIPVLDVGTENKDQTLQTLMGCPTFNCPITFNYGFKGLIGCLLFPFILIYAWLGYYSYLPNC